MLEIINQRYMKFLFDIDNKVRNISELAEKADLSKSVASTLISRLVREGVVLKERSKNERGKEILITLTEYGKIQLRLLRHLYENHQKNKIYMLNKASGGENGKRNDWRKIKTYLWWS